MSGHSTDSEGSWEVLLADEAGFAGAAPGQVGCGDGRRRATLRLVSLLRAYVDAWCRHDVAGVLAVLSDDCVVIESYGPVYRGPAVVERWMRAWFGAGGEVLGWEITAETDAGALLVAEWRFRCLWKGSEAAFDGISVAQVHNGRITRLREYVTTAPLYDWTGHWRD